MTKFSRRISMSSLSIMMTSFMTHALAADGFSGPYVGVEAGMGIMEMDGSTLAGPVSDTDNSGLVGGIIGYRMPIGGDGRVVVGVEGAAGLYTDGGNLRYAVYGTGGYRLSEDGLLYLKAGYSWHDDNNIDGFTYGAGYEHKLGGHMSMRLEYKRIAYDDINFPDNTFDFTGHEITAGVLFGF